MLTRTASSNVGTFLAEQPIAYWLRASSTFFLVRSRRWTSKAVTSFHSGQESCV